MAFCVVRRGHTSPFLYREHCASCRYPRNLAHSVIGVGVLGVNSCSETQRTSVYQRHSGQLLLRGICPGYISQGCISTILFVYIGNSIGQAVSVVSALNSTIPLTNDANGSLQVERSFASRCSLRVTDSTSSIRVGVRVGIRGTVLDSTEVGRSSEVPRN